MVLPSKELLSGVLRKDVYKIEKGDAFIDVDLKLTCDTSASIFGGDVGCEIWNIYELMHMMKEWAWEKEYNIDTSRVGKNLYFISIKSFDDEEVYFEELRNSVEFEAVTKTTEWILQEVKSSQ